MVSFWDWLFTPVYSERRAAKHGTIDGRLGIPAAKETAFADYEMRVKQAVEDDIRKAAQEWKRKDAPLLAAWCNTRRRIAELSGQSAKLEGGSMAAKEAVTATGTELHGHIHLPASIYWPLLLAIGAVEIPLNSVVFDIFGESPILKWLMTLGLALMLPACAHFLGAMLRKGLFRYGRVSAHLILAVTCAVLPLGALLGTAYIREKYFENATATGSFLTVKLDFTTITWIFFAINVLLYFTAVTASFLAHDPDAAKARANASAAKDDHRRLGSKAASVDAELADARRRHEVAAAQRKAAWSEVMRESDRWRDFAQRMIAVYREFNMRSRPENDRVRPITFQGFPPIKKVEDFESLGWDCDASVLEAGEAE